MRDVGGQALGAERGRANDVAIEKKMTVPPCGGGQDRAVLAAGHVDADDGDVGRPAGGRDGRGQGQRVAGVGDDDGVGQSACRASSCGLALDRDDADAPAAPASAAAARDSEPDLPAPPRTATVGAWPARGILAARPGRPAPVRRRRP